MERFGARACQVRFPPLGETVSQMHANGDPHDLPAATRAGGTLARMAGTLGIPTSAFFASGPHPNEIEAREQAALLDLVRTYLDRIDPEARRRFVETLRTLP